MNGHKRLIYCKHWRKYFITLLLSLQCRLYFFLLDELSRNNWFLSNLSNDIYYNISKSVQDTTFVNFGTSFSVAVRQHRSLTALDILGGVCLSIGRFACTTVFQKYFFLFICKCNLGVHVLVSYKCKNKKMEILSQNSRVASYFH